MRQTDVFKHIFSQVYHDKTWGTICSDFWDIDAAHVACRELNLGESQIRSLPCLWFYLYSFVAYITNQPFAILATGDQSLINGGGVGVCVGVWVHMGGVCLPNIFLSP